MGAEASLPASRYQKEASFHDALASGGERAADRFYALNRESSWPFYCDLLLSEAQRAKRDGHEPRILEYGCGLEAYSSRLLAANGVSVTGIDISPLSIRVAQDYAAREFPNVQLDYQVMNAESLDFPDRMFDLVCGNGILHHLIVDRAFAEVARVLAPTGSAIFSEPLGHNPLINTYRRLTPGQRTDDEHPLRSNDIRLARTYFAKVDAWYFHLASLLAIPAYGTRAFEPLRRTLDRVDSIIFKTIPPTRRYAWLAVLRLSEPHDAQLPKGASSSRRSSGL